MTREKRKEQAERESMERLRERERERERESERRREDVTFSRCVSDLLFFRGFAGRMVGLRFHIVLRTDTY